MSVQFRHQRGREVTPRHRASIITMRLSPNPMTFPEIAKQLDMKSSTCAKVFRHTQKQIPKEKQKTLSAYLCHESLDPHSRSGRPKILSEEEKTRLVETTKRNRDTRRMSLKDLQQEASLSRVSVQTCLNALHERGIKSYKENLKPILEESHRHDRYNFALSKLNWSPNQEWANWGWTDEMGVMIGGTWGVKRVWRAKGDDEKWANDCIGGKKTQGVTVMCWGLIGYNYKGPFHVWEAETEQERIEASIAISQINEIAKEEATRMEAEWRASSEWQELKNRELAEAKKLREEAKVQIPYNNIFNFANVFTGIGIKGTYDTKLEK